MAIKIRAHHVRDLFNLSGLYYSQEMKQKVSDLRRRLLDNPNIEIKVIQHKDYICKETCPLYKKKCSGERLKDFDKYFAKLLNIRIGTIYLVSGLVKKSIV